MEALTSSCENRHRPMAMAAADILKTRLRTAVDTGNPHGTTDEQR
jgi:hypothetical protein